MVHNVTLIPGDGIGPEVTEAARRVLEATGVAFRWDVAEAGALSALPLNMRALMAEERLLLSARPIS